MPKTPRLKTNNPSKHSRAARRTAEPPTKTLADQTEEADEIRHIKQTQRYAGVSKKRSKAKPLTRSQRLRREKGMERAEAVLDQIEIKKAISSGRGKMVKERSGAWEDVNGKIIKDVKTQGFAVLAGHDGGVEYEDDGWEDVDDNVDGKDAVQEREAINAVTALHVSGEAQSGGLGGGSTEEDEVCDSPPITVCGMMIDESGFAFFRARR